MASAVPQQRSRNTDRELFDDHTRLVLAEQDLDHGERQFATLVNEMRGVKSALVGVILTAASATIVGAINLVIGGIGK